MADNRRNTTLIPAAQLGPSGRPRYHTSPTTDSDQDDATDGALYPGTFDPNTKRQGYCGERATPLFDQGALVDA
ncbi:hypothetical protein EWW49_36530, partial [Pseudomonas syringae]